MMDQGTNDGLHKESADAPFEWLTNFRSIRHLVLPSRIIDGSLPPLSQEDGSEPNNDGADSSSSASEQPAVKLNALHVGCGTSTVGESLLCLRERTHNHLLQYGHVMNVDNDKQALASMQRRWENRKPLHVDRTIANEIEMMGTMEWKYLDFKSDESCRQAMDGVYRELMYNTTPVSDPGGCFDLVLDKSTLDCLLCAETSVVAHFLCEVYRALRVPKSSSSLGNVGKSIDSTPLPASWGGVYVLITFHPAEFIERLLTQLPGATWHVDHEVIKREVEDINKHGICEVDEVNHASNNSSNTDVKEQRPCPSPSAWSSGTFHPDENYRKTVNVFTCRRCAEQSEDNPSPQNCILDPKEVFQHIERTCDEWYKTTNPMVTREREEQIRMAFLGAATTAKNGKDDKGEGRHVPSSSKDDVLDLKQCYDIIFTDAEREHLSYEYYLEDWTAYCERADNIGGINQDGMTVETALDFLREMQ